MAITDKPFQQPKCWVDKFTGFAKLKDYQNALSQDDFDSAELHHSNLIRRAKKRRAMSMARKNAKSDVMVANNDMPEEE